jgi:hypothetical protein
MSGEILKINLKTCDRNFCVNQSEGYHTLKNPEREGDLGIHYDDLLESLRSKENAFKGTLECKKISKQNLNLPFSSFFILGWCVLEENR